MNCSPFRKSVYDSIVSGCIPVLFSPDSDAVSPWHWGLFRESSRVLLTESEYMAARPGVEGLRVLYDMPQKQIAELQASIARYAHRLQVICADLAAGQSRGYNVFFNSCRSPLTTTPRVTTRLRYCSRRHIYDRKGTRWRSLRRVGSPSLRSLRIFFSRITYILGGLTGRLL